MAAIYTTPRFDRALKKFLKKHPELRDQVEERLTLLASNPQDARLSTHQLRGALRGLWAASLSYEYRLVFSWEGEKIVLLNIGSHEEVY